MPGLPQTPQEVIPTRDVNGKCIVDITTKLGSQEMVVHGSDGRNLCSYLTSNGVGTFVDVDGNPQNLDVKEAVVKALRTIHIQNQE